MDSWCLCEYAWSAACMINFFSKCQHMGLEYKSQLCAYSAYSPVLALICKKPFQRMESLTSIHLFFKKKDQTQNNGADIKAWGLFLLWVHKVHKDDFSGSVNYNCVWWLREKWKKKKQDRDGGLYIDLKMTGVSNSSSHSALSCWWSEWKRFYSAHPVFQC